MMTLSVRENAALVALPQFARFGVVQRRAEVDGVERQREALGIKAPSLGTEISALSGGNQQKVVLARSLLAQPSLVLADEPTQGVDAAARVELYRILRGVADSGIPVLIVSSDNLELEGLCDRIVVFSRGHVVGELAGAEVTEEKIAQAVVTATTHRREAAGAARGRPTTAPGIRRRPRQRLRGWATGDYAPSVILALAIVALGAYTWSHNPRYLSPFNVTSVLTLLAGLAFISLGQLCVILTGGIDISVGPLAGLLVVIASFFVNDGKPATTAALGVLLMLATAVAVGLVNGCLVRFGRFTPVAATLTTYIALQGVSLLLRPFQGGLISTVVVDRIETAIGAIPVAILAATALAAALEYCLRHSRWGLNLRAVGSRERAAHRLGVRVNRTVVGAYVACSLLTFLGGIMLMAQIGIGDPTQGVTYTLASITVVVLGGTSLLGGRGSFIGALLGAALIQQILNATTFLHLSQAWQYWFQGIGVLLAAGLYTHARRSGVAPRGRGDPRAAAGPGQARSRTSSHDGHYQRRHRDVKALVFEAPKRAVVADLEQPEIGPDEVLVRSRMVGICHSDFELYEGRYIIPISYPVIPGHEWAGEVVETGAAVVGPRPGDRVVGECVVGPGGRDHFGFSINGANAEYLKVRAEWLHLLPDALSWTQGALVEPFSVAYNATVSAGGVDASDVVAVLGGGPIGLLCTLAASASNAAVVLVEPRRHRRDKGLALGARLALDPTAGDFADAVAEATKGRGFDAVIEATGAPAAMASALELAGHGARIVYLGIDVGSTAPARLGLIQSKALRIRGVIGSAGLWPQTIRFLASGVADPSRIVTACYPLGSALEALAAARDTAHNLKVHIQTAP
ncbi:MAG TPA: zinc-binding dehydrogenase [Actinomycetota bacterium]